MGAQELALLRGGRGAVGGVVDGGSLGSTYHHAPFVVEEAAVGDRGGLGTLRAERGRGVRGIGRGLCRPSPFAAAICGAGVGRAADGLRIVEGEELAPRGVGEVELAALAVQAEGGVLGVDLIAAAPDAAAAVGRYGAEACGQRPLQRAGGIVAQVAAAQSQLLVRGIVELHPAVEVEGGTHLHVRVGRHDLVHAEVTLGRLVELRQVFNLDVVHHQPVVRVGHLAVVVHADVEHTVAHLRLNGESVGSLFEGQSGRFHGIGEPVFVIRVVAGEARVAVEPIDVLAGHLHFHVARIEERAALVRALDKSGVRPRVAAEAEQRLHAHAVATVGQLQLARHVHPALPHLDAAHADQRKAAGLAVKGPVGLVARLERGVLEILARDVHPTRLGLHAPADKCGSEQDGQPAEEYGVLFHCGII